MLIRYLYHSGFALECDSCTIIIDYFNDDCEGERCAQQGVVADDTLRRELPLYVLSSHGHRDHFNPAILRWQMVRPDVHYVLSRDILASGLVALHENMVFLTAGERYEDDCVKIQAFGSTDLGISFLIQVDGKTVFHAGDLNNWHWQEEQSEEEADKAEQAYLLELSILAAAHGHLDAAMFPVDPRLGADGGRGALQLMATIDVDALIPMHYGDDVSFPLAFAKAHEDLPLRVLSARGDAFTL